MAQNATEHVQKTVAGMDHVTVEVDIASMVVILDGVEINAEMVSTNKTKQN